MDTGQCEDITRKKCPSGRRFTNEMAVQIRRAVFYSPQGFVRVPGPFVIFGQSQVVLVAQQEQILGYDHCRRRRGGRRGAANRGGRLVAGPKYSNRRGRGRTDDGLWRVVGRGAAAFHRGRENDRRRRLRVFFKNFFYSGPDGRVEPSSRHRTLSPPAPVVSCGLRRPRGDGKRAIGDVRARRRGRRHREKKENDSAKTVCARVCVRMWCVRVCARARHLYTDGGDGAVFFFLFMFVAQKILPTDRDGTANTLTM